MTTGPGQVRVSFEYRRHLGPRYMHGAVTLLFDAFQPYSFSSTASWPSEAGPSAPYEAAIRASVEEVLLAHMGSLATVRVVLEAIAFHSVDSSPLGFRVAARAATEAAFGTLPNAYQVAHK